MQQLDRALMNLADRGDAVGADVMVERLERRLSGEPDAVVVALKSRRSDVQTQERETVGDSGSRQRKGLLIAAAAFIGVIAVGGIILAAGTIDRTAPAAPASESTTTAVASVDETRMTPAEGEALVTEFVAALKAGDSETTKSLVEGATGTDGFLDWLIVLDTTGVEFFDCVYSIGSVRCTTTSGPNHFFERIHGQTSEHQFSAGLVDGTIRNASWPPAAADYDAAREFMAWAKDADPELWALISDGTPMGVLTTEAGMALMANLDNYLASL